MPRLSSSKTCIWNSFGYRKCLQTRQSAQTITPVLPMKQRSVHQLKPVFPRALVYAHCILNSEALQTDLDLAYVKSPPTAALQQASFLRRRHEPNLESERPVTLEPGLWSPRTTATVVDLRSRARGIQTRH